MNEQEQEDLNKLQQEIKDLKISHFDQCSFIMRHFDPATSGHKTQKDALEWTIKNFMTKIDKLTKDHIKKYPD